jgi:hypothetical protein
MRHLSFLLLLSLPFSVAAAPFTLTNQGYLSDASGSGLSGTHDLTFALYDDDAATNTALWTETVAFEFVDGVYAVTLGNTQAINEDVLEQYPLFLGMSVDGASEMTPRLALASVPYAILAETSSNVDGGTVVATSIEGDSLTVGGTTIDSSGVITSTQSGEWDAAATAIGDFTDLAAVQAIQSGDFALSGQTCAAGQVMIGINASGGPICGGFSTYRTICSAAGCTTPACDVGDILLGCGQYSDPAGDADDMDHNPDYAARTCVKGSNDLAYGLQAFCLRTP